MYYEQARKKAKKFRDLKGVKNRTLQGNVINSIVNQARLHEGDQGAGELVRELSDQSHSAGRLGWTSKYEKKYEEIYRKKK